MGGTVVKKIGNLVRRHCLHINILETYEILASILAKFTMLCRRLGIIQILSHKNGLALSNGLCCIFSMQNAASGDIHPFSYYVVIFPGYYVTNIHDILHLELGFLKKL